MKTNFLETDMISETHETFALRELHEELVIKNENDENNEPVILLNRIKIEPSDADWDKCDERETVKINVQNETQINTERERKFLVTEINEQVFIKSESDENTEAVSGIILNSIKSEKYDADNKNTVEINFKNYESEKSIDSEFKEKLIKNEYYENADAISGIVIERIKNEHSGVDNFDDSVANGNEDLNNHLNEVKSETDIDSKEFEVTEITEEYTIKSENETSMDGILDLPTNSMGKNIIPRNQHQVVYEKVGRKSFSCYHCNYTAYNKHRLRSHLKMHDNKKYVNLPRPGFEIDDHTKRKHSSAIASVYKRKSSGIRKVSVCIHCAAKFKDKRALDDHVLKNHPNLIKSVTSKLYECSKCLYKTTKKVYFDRHVSVHFEVTSDSKLSTCIHCNIELKSKASLDHHIVKKHSNFITSVSNKIHECTRCSYKTTRKGHFNRHMSVHSEVTSDYTCIHCNMEFKIKASLDDHVIKKHPKFITSITNKIYECTGCSFKTTRKNNFDRHMSVHSEVTKDYTCIHCNIDFKSKASLDDHVVKKHPNFITSITNKIYECTRCGYKTTKKVNFERHLPMHSDTFITCVHCNDLFKNQTSLDHHIVKTHPHCITSIVSKLYECSRCIYKAVYKTSLDRHMIKHLE